MRDPIKYTKDHERFLRLEERKLDAGWMGRVFGTTTWAAASIAWVTIFMLIGSGILILFVNCTVKPIEYWKIIGPIVTLALGYLFGRSGK